MKSEWTMSAGLRGLSMGLVVALAATGCASQKFVRNQDEASRVALSEELSREIEGVADQVQVVEGEVDALEGEVEVLSATTREALERAVEAGKLAEGKFLYETVLSDDGVRFGFERASLSDDAREALDTFASGVKERNRNVYIEIQGHTDASGEENYNLLLGKERAESVRRYLSLEHQMPLHRMAIISYGETSPIADNTTREGRARNRRVSLVVLQ